MITASTPTPTMARRSSGALTVHTLTARPAACARPTSSASTQLTKGWTAAEPGVDRLGQRPTGVDGEPPERAEGQAGVGGLHRQQRRDLERRHDDPVRPARLVDRRRRQGGHGLPGSHPGSWGAFLISTFTTIPSQTARTSARRGTWAGRSATPRVRDHAEARDLGVVVDRQAAVGGQAHVELDPVGTEPPGLGERVERVLDETLRVQPL